MLVKSDGKFVYATYGNEIVNVNGTSVVMESRTKLPTLSPEYGEGNCDRIEGRLLIGGNRLVVITTRQSLAIWVREEDEDSQSTDRRTINKVVITRGYLCTIRVTCQLLEKKHFMVITFRQCQLMI